MKSFTSILWGIVLVALGVVLGLNALDITNIDIFFDGWWTLFIIVPSFIDLLTDDDKTGSIIGLIVGICLLLCCNDFLSFGLIWKLMVPFVLVIIGLSCIFKNSILNKKSKKIAELNSKNSNDSNVYYATFSGQDIDYSNRDFTGCDLTATFGGIKCDLRDANISDEAVVNVNATFGGVDVLVPNDVRVITSSNSIFGGVECKKKKKDAYTKTIYVKATCLFGGVDIK